MTLQPASLSSFCFGSALYILWCSIICFFFNDTATTEIYTLSPTRRSSDLLRLPNLLHESVPVGKDDTENVEVARWGTPRRVDFELKSHSDILEALRLADFDRARKIAGAGFVYLLGDLVRLDQALLAFGLNYMVKQGFTAVFPPFMMRRDAYEGVVDLGDFETVMYKIDGEDLFLTAPSEHPMGAMYMDEIIDEADLPIALAGLSTQFRREIGGDGGDTKGLVRLHQS